MGLGKACKKIIVPPIYQKFQFENISLVRPTLLKIYFWEQFNIDGLNKQLNTDSEKIHHVMHMVERYCNSQPIKVIFWIRNTSKETLELRLKRIQNCECQPKQTRVGFNQYRNLYHCPHRRLIHLLQEFHVLQPDDLVALSMTFFFFLLGEHKLTYEIRTSDNRIIILDIHLHVTTFEPENCVLTRQLFPSNLKTQHSFMQAIWIRNSCLQSLNFNFTTNDSRLKIYNSNLTVPQQSIWPLLAEFKATDVNNEIELNVGFDGKTSKVCLHGEGVATTNYDDIVVPNDYECAEAPTVIYPNSLKFDIVAQQKRSLMIVVHNHGATCMEYRWQSYALPDIFDIKIKPKTFRLKPRHNHLCVVILQTYKKAMQFTRIPCILEVHKNLSKSIKMAQALLEEIESIDCPEWKQNSYVEHYFLNMNISMPAPEQTKPRSFCYFRPLETTSLKRSRDYPLGASRLTKKTIFEKKYWEELSNSHYMRKNEEHPMPDNLNYEEVLNYGSHPPLSKGVSDDDTFSTLSTLCELLSETLRDISKNWVFIPMDYAGLD